MSDTIQKRKFVKQVWDCFMPTYELPSTRLEGWFPSDLRKMLGPTVNKKSVLPYLDNGDMCLKCFNSAQERISRTWENIMSDAKEMIFNNITDLSLWSYFDPKIIRMAQSDKEHARVRFDIADIIYHGAKEQFFTDIKNMDVNIEDKFATNLKTTEPKIIELAKSLVKSRAQIDIAILVAQNITRYHNILDRIADRTTAEMQEYYGLLKQIFQNSTLYTTSSGKTFFGYEEEAKHHMSAIQWENLTPRLRLYETYLQDFINNVSRIVPPRTFVDQSTALLGASNMTQNPANIMNITITGGQIGFLNAGNIEKIKTIDQSVGALRDSGAESVARAIKGITESVVESQGTLSDEEKNDLLDQLNLLGQQASEPRDKRSAGVVKSVCNSLPEGLKAAARLTEAWEAWGPHIRTFFGI